MPSVVVHIAVGALLATSLLTERFDTRAAVVVLGAAAFPDLDTLLGLWIQGGHRAILHNLLLPTAIGIVLLADFVGKNRIEQRWGAYGVRVAWVGLIAYVGAGIGLDLFTSGVNVFYPIHDQFYSVSGELSYSNEHGIVDTFLTPQTHGTTHTTHYDTGFDLAQGSDPKHGNRVFPVVRSGRQLLLGAMSFGILGFRIWESRKK